MGQDDCNGLASFPDSLTLVERRVLVAAATALLGCLIACGSRSSLKPGDRRSTSSGTNSTAAAGGTGGSGIGGAPAGGMGGNGGVNVGGAVSTSTGPPCLSDQECDDGVSCTIDVCDMTSGCSNTTNHAACDDGTLCTVDSCHLQSGCSNTFSDAPCNDSIGCTNDFCDAATDSCRNASCDSLCDDNVFCNGVERCDTTLGCTNGPNACDLELGCGVSTCNEAQASCQSTLPNGCLPPTLYLLVTDSSGALYSVKPYDNGANTLIAPPNGNVHFDIAILGSRWFAIGGGGTLLELTPFSNQVIASHSTIAANSLSAGPDGMLYAATTNAYRINPDTGASEFIAALPPDHSSSGDIAFIGQRMFVSCNSPCGGTLAEVDIINQTSVSLGGDGLGCVYGLGAFGNQLMLMNCDGTVGTFNPDVGIAGILSTTAIIPYGADILP